MKIGKNIIKTLRESFILPHSLFSAIFYRDQLYRVEDKVSGGGYSLKEYEKLFNKIFNLEGVKSR